MKSKDWRQKMWFLWHMDPESSEILRVGFVFSASDIFPGWVWILCRGDGVDGVNGGYQKSTCPPAGHSVIHKMRPFQTSLHPVVAVMSIGKKIWK